MSFDQRQTIRTNHWAAYNRIAVNGLQPFYKQRSRLSVRSFRWWLILTLVIVQTFFLHGISGASLWGIVSGGILLLLIVSSVVEVQPTISEMRKLYGTLLVFLVLTMLGIGIGILRGCSNIDIAKDFMKFGNVFLLLHFLKGPYGPEKIKQVVKVTIIAIYIATVVAFFGKIGIRVPYFIASVDYAGQCIPIVLIAVAELLFNPKMRVSPVILMFPAFCTLIISMTRTYWLGTILGLTILYFLKSKDFQKRGIWPIVISIGILVICCYMVVGGIPFVSMEPGEVSISEKIEKRFEFIRMGRYRDEPSLANRIDEVIIVIESIENWVVGNGLGESVLINTTAYADREHWEWVPSTWFHNAYLFFLLKMGLLGLGVFLAILLLLLRIGYQKFVISSGYNKALSASFIAYLVSASVMSLATGNFVTPRCWLILGICGGAVINNRTYAKHQKGKSTQGMHQRVKQKTQG